MVKKIILGLGHEVGLHSSFIIRVCFPFNDCNGSQGTLPQTIPEPITEFIRNQAGHTVNNLDSPFMTSGDT